MAGSRRTRRTVRMGALGALAAVAVSGCAVGQAGAAAFVGADRIASATVTGWVGTALGDRPEGAPAVDAPAFSRQVLTVLVREPLLEQTAERLDVPADERAIAEALDPVVREAGGEAAYAAQREANGIPAAYLDTWRRVEGLQLVLSEALASELEVAEEELRQAWLNDPELSTLPYEQVRDDIRQSLLAERSGALLLAELQTTAEEEGVEVSERYGIFDLVGLAVVASLPATVRPPVGTVPLPGFGQ